VSDGGKKARLTRESTKETVKTIAQETPDATAEPVVTMLVCFFISHTRLRVRLGARRFLRPLFSEGEVMNNSGASASRECEDVLNCHHRACPGDPRLTLLFSTTKTWMAGTTPGHDNDSIYVAGVGNDGLFEI
jgi:hypothetical protein